MKKLILFSVILFFTGLNVSLAQMVKVNPIPCYNYYMTQEYAAFQEQGTGETREKREVNIVVNPGSDAETDIFATVTFVKKNGTEVLGPFTVYADQTFTLELPKGKWGAIVNSSYDLFVSIWIGNNPPPARNN
jgi:hypothetical protein